MGRKLAGRKNNIQLFQHLITFFSKTYPPPPNLPDNAAQIGDSLLGLIHRWQFVSGRSRRSKLSPVLNRKD